MTLHGSCPVELRISLLLDGLLSDEETKQIHRHFSECESCRQKYVDWEHIIHLVRETCSVRLTPVEKNTFLHQFNQQIVNSDLKTPCFTVQIARFLAQFRPIPWQWRAAFALILILIFSIPFLPNNQQEPQELFIPTLASDFSDAKIRLETDVAAEYDLIWVVTGEEETQKTLDSSLGFKPFMTI
jgi:hypothetical protein